MHRQHKQDNYLKAVTQKQQTETKYWQDYFGLLSLTVMMNESFTTQNLSQRQNPTGKIDQYLCMQKTKIIQFKN